MKRIVVIAALATLAACQQEAAPAPEPAEEAAAPAEAAATAATVAADGKPSTGTFTVTTADGMVFTEEVKPDGTYVQTDKDGKVVETGKWVQKSPTEYCTTADEEGAPEKCNVEGIDDKGVWSSKGPDGKTATVVRVK